MYRSAFRAERPGARRRRDLRACERTGPVVRILLLGVSTRALAESAVVGGHDVVAVDYFGDQDLERVAESHALLRDLHLPLSAHGLGEAARRVEAGAVAYAANVENPPEIVEGLAGERVLLGNGPTVLRQVRD